MEPMEVLEQISQRLKAAKLTFENILVAGKPEKDLSCRSSYKESGEMIGELWIECKDWEMGTHEVGYFVVQDETKKGLASEATRAGIQLIFNELQGYKVALTCDEDNIASYRVAERCGFVREAVIRDATQRPDGSRIGMLMYGMLKSEYEKMRTA